MRRALLAVILLLVLAPRAAQAQEDCVNSLVFTIPGVTWQDVERERPPEILRAIEEGAAATVAVRTNAPNTDYGSGFLTIGTGTRANVEGTAGGPGGVGSGSETNSSGLEPERGVSVGGWDEILLRADEDDYGAAPGSLGSALDSTLAAVGNSDPGNPVPAPLGYGRYALLAAMDKTGVVDVAYTGEQVIAEDPDAPFGIRSDTDALLEAVRTVFDDDPCAVAVVDPGDLIRADMASAIAGEELRDDRNEALAAADGLLGSMRSLLDDKDLLIVVTPTSPQWNEQTHLGVTVAVGPDFEPGTTLRSSSTNRNGVVTLPDIAPTVLNHYGIDRPSDMLGRPMQDTPAPFEDRTAGFASFDREAVYMHYTNPIISTVFVLVQVVLYAIAIALLWTREDKPRHSPWLIRALEGGALAVTAFPLATYLTTPLQAHVIEGWAYIGIMLTITAVAVALAWFFLKDPLDRFFALIVATFIVVVVDQFAGGPLQLNAVWGIDPITAGRFDGLGNISFAILGTTGLLTGALLLRKFPERRWTLFAVAAVFALTIAVDGAPNLGADVGGVLALVPALGLSFVLLTGRRPRARTLIIFVLGAIAVLVGFLIFDLSRPEGSRTHLARLYEDVSDRGLPAFADVIFRKARANLRLFRTTIWTYLVPFALGLLAYLIYRPTGAWSRLAGGEPKLRAALLGGMLVGIFGFAVNDSGIVVTAMVLSYLVPLALVFHLTAEPEPE